MRRRSTLSKTAGLRVAAEIETREEAGLMARFRAFLDREGIQGDDRRLALGETELDDLRDRLRRFLGFGVALAGAILVVLSLSSIFGDHHRVSGERGISRVESTAMSGVEARIALPQVRRPQP